MEKETKAVILVVGAGTMGSGIAQVFAANGHKTYLSDLKAEYLQTAKQRIETAVKGLIREQMATESYAAAVEQNLICITNDQIPSIGQEADVVIEAIYENPDAKREMYAVLNAACRADCILASNTSGMDVFSICQDVVDHPERQIITHWFNPPHLMKLIEVVAGPKTSEETIATVRTLLESIGRKPAVIRHFVQGFIVNRIAAVINRELYYMIENGWITAEDAENAIRYTNGLRYSFEGPIALWDYVGLEIPMIMAKGVLPTLCSQTDTIPYGDKMMAEGKLGTRVGEGLLKWPDPEGYTEKRNRRIIQMTKILEEFDREDKA